MALQLDLEGGQTPTEELKRKNIPDRGNSLSKRKDDQIWQHRPHVTEGKQG